MMLCKIFTFYWAIALVGCAAAMPLDPRQFPGPKRITLGYRTVSPEQARMYNAKGKIVFDPATSRGNQIGVGVYTTPGPGDWAGNPGDWHCQITARESAIRKIPKLWVPREYFWVIGSGRDTNPMYDWAERVLQGKADFDTSFHLSVIDRHDPPGLKQLVIPTYLLSGHGLDLKVTCKADYRALPDNKRVNYSSWPNTYGTPQ